MNAPEFIEHTLSQEKLLLLVYDYENATDVLRGALFKHNPQSVHLYS